MLLATGFSGVGVSRPGWRDDLVVVLVACRRGVGFAMSTGIRVVLYSVGFIALVRLLEGPAQTGLYAAAFVVVGPTLIAGSTMPWIGLPRLAVAASEGTPRLRREALLHLSAYLSVAAGGALLLTLAWGWWIGVSLGPSAFADQIHDQRLLIIFLMGGILLTFWSGTLAQARRQPGVELVAVILAGASGILCLVLTGNVVLSAGVPYWVAIGIVGTTGLVLPLPADRTLRSGAPGQ